MQKLLFALVLASGILGIIFIDQWQISQWQEKKAVELAAAVQLSQTRLKSAIEHRFHSIQAIAALFVLHPDTSRTEFNRFAATIMQFSPPIRAVQYADASTRITYVFPSAGNEITFETPLTLLDDPLRKPFVQKAIQQKRPVIQGPFPLRQGGRGLALRWPLFDNDTFAGLVIGVYDLDVLIDEAIQELELDNVTLMLADQEKSIFWPSSTATAAGSFYQFSIADTDWHIAGSWTAPPAYPLLSRILLWIVCLGFWSAGWMAIGLLWNQSRRLEQMVAQRTATLDQSDRELRASEEKFRLAFHTSPDSININRFDDGLYLEINQGFTRILGYTAEEVLGKTSIELNIWKNPEDREKLVSQLNTHGVVENMEAVFQGKDSKQIIGLMSARVMTLNAEKVLLNITRDITDRKQMEKDRERLLSAIEQVAESIVITDTDGRIEYVNPAFETITGYSRSEAIGQNPRILKSGEQDAAVYTDLWDTITSGETWTGRLINQKKDGTLYTEEATISPVFDPEGRMINYVAVKRDITGEIDITRRLHQSQKMEAIGTLAGGIAHDFNNILFPIVGHTEMLIDDLPEGSPVRESIDEIYTSALRAKELVKQILAFSRQEKQEPRMMKLQPIIKETIRMIRASIPTTIEITHDIDPDCGSVRADPTQMHQIVMNLATNAYHAMEETGGTLHIALRQETPASGLPEMQAMAPGSYACLTVSDTGLGMSQAVAEKIFDPFFTTKQKGKGTGMGLSVVHGIVTQMNGAIRVQSEPGSGTDFYLYFPVETESSEPEPGIHTEHLKRGTEKILLVDDEAAIISIEQRILERMGYQVCACTGSMEALELFRANPAEFDLVITDLTMPRMAGDKLAAEMIQIRPDIPILLCTGFSETIAETDMAAMGIGGLLFKPIVTTELSQKIRNLLDTDT